MPTINRTKRLQLTEFIIATAALGVGSKDLVNDMRTFGLMFETMAIRDLRCYAEALDGSVNHYLDAAGLECDAIIRLRNGAYGLVEIKTGGKSLIAEGKATLKALSDKIDTTRMPKPMFRMILVANGEFAYKDSDGDIICPITCLGV